MARSIGLEKDLAMQGDRLAIIAEAVALLDGMSQDDQAELFRDLGYNKTAIGDPARVVEDFRRMTMASPMKEVKARARAATLITRHAGTTLDT